MGFLPSQGSARQIDIAIQQGRGVVGAVLGLTYQVYRLNASSTGQLVQPSNLVNFPGGATLLPAKVKRTSSIPDIETNWVTKIPLFEAMCDARFLRLGDVLVETGFGSDNSVFTFVYRRPITNKSILVQTPLACLLSRPSNNPTMIDGGRVPYAGAIKAAELVCTLFNGSYYFVPANSFYPGTKTPVQSATIYMGLQPETRRGSAGPANLHKPTDVPTQKWAVFMANLPNVELMERDVVTGGDGDRFSVLMPAPQAVGLQGVQAFVERLIA
jgi:hypothetical protein